MLETSTLPSAISSGLLSTPEGQTTRKHTNKVLLQYVAYVSHLSNYRQKKEIWRERYNLREGCESSLVAT